MRLSSALVILPLLLTRFSAEDTALWYMISTFIALQSLIDFGFFPTFTRLLSYAMGGTSISQLVSGTKLENVPHAQRGIAHESLALVFSAMQKIYARLAWISVLSLATIGTLALANSINASSEGMVNWIGWAIVIFGTAAMMSMASYNCLLQATGRIPNVRRIEILAGLIASLAGIATILLGGGVNELCFANQVSLLIAPFILRIIVRRTETWQQMSKVTPNPQQVAPLIRAAWGTAWRSGIGVAMSYGVTQLTGVIYAQLASAKEVAAYLIALRIMGIISQFCQAPFYSKLPLMAQHLAKGDVDGVIRQAKKGMAFSLWILVISFGLVGLFLPVLMTLIHSQTQFVPNTVWFLLGVAVFIERLGAMHMQLYSTTNHILWHIANSVSGSLTLLFILVLYPLISVYAFPAAMAAGYLLFYTPYSIKKSYGQFGLHFLSFDFRTSFIPGVLAFSLFGFSFYMQTR